MLDNSSEKLRVLSALCTKAACSTYPYITRRHAPLSATHLQLKMFTHDCALLMIILQHSFYGPLLAVGVTAD
jgi:hypothetical protein